jgi:hypothetical protein
VLKVDLIIRNAAQLVTCAAGGKVKRGAEMQNVGIVATERWQSATAR